MKKGHLLLLTVILITLFLLTVSFCLKADHSEIKIELVEPDLLETLPGNKFTLSFLIINQNRKGMDLETKVILPTGFKILTYESNLNLEPKQSKVELLNLYIPHNIKKGTYTIKYLLLDQDNNIRAEKKLQLTIKPNFDLEAIIIRSPDRVIAGESYIVNFSINNRSNTDLSINIKCHDQPSFKTMLSQKYIELSPNKISFLNVKVKTNPHINTSKTHKITLSIECLYNNKKVISKAIDTSVKVLNRISGKNEDYIKLPFDLDAIFSYDKQLDINFDLSTLKPIDTDKKHWLFLQLKTEDLLKKSNKYSNFKGNYQLKYWNNNTALEIGDNYFTATELTEKQKNGKGFLVKIEKNNIFLKTYYQKSKDNYDMSWAVLYDYQYLKNIDFISSLFHKIMNNDHINILSLNSKIKLLNNIFDFEYAQDLTNKTNHAYYGKLTTNNDNLNYQLKYLYSDPKFSGRVSDCKHLVCNFSYSPLNNLSIKGIFEKFNNNLNLDLSQQVKNESSTKIFTQYHDTNSNLHLIYNNLWIKDLRPNPDFFEQRTTWKIKYKHHFDNGKFKAVYSSTSINDHLLKEIILQNLISIKGTYKIYDEQLYSIYYENKFEKKNRDILLNVSADFSINKNNNITLNYAYQSKVDKKTNQQNNKNIISLELHNSLKEFNSQFKLKGTYIKSKKEDNEFILQVEYIKNFSFDLPITRKKTGKIIGRIYNPNKEKQDGIKDVIVKISELTAVTNEDGYFIFNQLKPGIHYLNIDLSSMKQNQVFKNDLPLEFTIKANENKKIILKTVKGCSVSGQAMVYNYSQLNKSKKIYPDYFLKKLQIILKNKENNKYIIKHTDTFGKFHFENLRPGIWELIIKNRGTIPENHALKKPNYIFEITPGQNKNIEIKVLPLERKLNLIDTGKI